ncbi:immunoglobulin-like domain-containing protein [Thermococcus radiotolerans]|uniref:Bacterial Ig-like domain-containing protein n=1 Tax=Thermococcus radiotolerans TaxID=187880 RepID=A0A2Z2N0F6_9EURY|nr:immunoglobulin-like domain-containing protein [Thermococcus radiotolerans]ASJ13920.1 hypothetical protein A3L10_01760 [Thermococcus radiotolerans]
MNRTLVVFAVFVLLLGILYVGTRETAKNTHSDAGTALMRLDKGTYRVGEDLTLTIINTGSETLLVGASYRLYRLEDDKWEEISPGFTFTMIGYTIPPGGNWTQRIPLVILVKGKSAFGTLEPIPPGKYRIEKTVIIDRGRCGGRSDEIRLSAEFEVVG